MCHLHHLKEQQQLDSFPNTCLVSKPKSRAPYIPALGLITEWGRWSPNWTNWLLTCHVLWDPIDASAVLSTDVVVGNFPGLCPFQLIFMKLTPLVWVKFRWLRIEFWLQTFPFYGSGHLRQIKLTSSNSSVLSIPMWCISSQGFLLMLSQCV